MPKGNQMASLDLRFLFFSVETVNWYHFFSLPIHSPDPREIEKSAAGLSPHSMQRFLPLLPPDFASFCSCCVPGLPLLLAYLVFSLLASAGPSHCQWLCATPLSSWFAVASIFCLKSPCCLHSLTQRYCVTNTVMIYRRPDRKFLNPVDYFKSHFTWFFVTVLDPTFLKNHATLIF